MSHSVHLKPRSPTRGLSLRAARHTTGQPLSPATPPSISLERKQGPSPQIRVPSPETALCWGQPSDSDAIPLRRGSGAGGTHRTQTKKKEK